jgi:hypothetical protein
MGRTKVQPFSADAWKLVARQHGVVTRRQLLDLGLGSEAITHRLETGRLHRAGRGIYAVGRPELSREGRWMAAVLACGPGAVLSHRSAGALWGLGVGELAVEVTVPTHVRRRRPGVEVHRKVLSGDERALRHSIPATDVHRTLLDLALTLDRPRLERTINEADKLDLTDPEQLRAKIGQWKGRPGVAILRLVLDRRTFTLTDSELERRFLPIAARAGLSLPEAGCRLNGFKVDFFWPDIGLVVETDGLRYHRTAAQQTRDRLRDQAHAAAGLTPLRFTHAQVRYEPRYVQATLRKVAKRLAPPNSD